ncbi:intradiol ring-cleavage dioxygenase [Streptomyces sp. NPDC005408]|uniref:intradiol ring-cleavage dioxygenase n=1 Tax=Streptomyces sp. NPDC005408 TaxID=3155341 RepID=UPI00339F48F1
MSESPHPQSEPSNGRENASRRAVLTGLGATALSLAAAGFVAPEALGASLQDKRAQTPAAAPLEAACVLTPEQTEGPYYLDLETVRKNITEGKTGVPLTLRTTVIDTRTCAPIPNVAVDIWHCDAVGIYSGYVAGGSTPDTTFLRGVQLTNSSGVAEFTTIYPGWYVGRALHIHLKTHVGGTVSGGTYEGGHVSHTGQLYFPENYNTQVAALTPYRTNTARRTLNSQDGIYRNGGSSTLLAITLVGSTLSEGVIGTVVLGINPTATP